MFYYEKYVTFNDNTACFAIFSAVFGIRICCERFFNTSFIKKERHNSIDTLLRIIHFRLHSDIVQTDIAGIGKGDKKRYADRFMRNGKRNNRRHEGGHVWTGENKRGTPCSMPRIFKIRSLYLELVVDSEQDVCSVKVKTEGINLCIMYLIMLITDETYMGNKV